MQSNFDPTQMKDETKLKPGISFLLGKTLKNQNPYKMRTKFILLLFLSLFLFNRTVFATSNPDQETKESFPAGLLMKKICRFLAQLFLFQASTREQSPTPMVISGSSNSMKGSMRFL